MITNEFGVGMTSLNDDQPGKMAGVSKSSTRPAFAASKRVPVPLHLPATPESPAPPVPAVPAPPAPAVPAPPVPAATVVAPPPVPPAPALPPAPTLPPPVPTVDVAPEAVVVVAPEPFPPPAPADVVPVVGEGLKTLSSEEEHAAWTATSAKKDAMGTSVGRLLGRIFSSPTEKLGSLKTRRQNK